MMIEKDKPNYGLFLTSIIVYSIVNLILAILLVDDYIQSSYQTGFWDLIFVGALLLWQFAHIGLCCYFYFSDAKLPLAARVYLYIDMVIFGAIMIGALVLAISYMINGCHDDNSYIPTCFLVGLLCVGVLAIAWSYGGCNLLMAYCVLQLQKTTDVEYFAVASNSVKQIQ